MRYIDYVCLNSAISLNHSSSFSSLPLFLLHDGDVIPWVYIRLGMYKFAQS